MTDEGYGALATQAPPQEPHLIHFRIERMVNGYIVDIGESYDPYAGSSAASKGPRHLVTSREKLIELLTELAPHPLTKPNLRWDTGQPIEEKKW